MPSVYGDFVLEFDCCSLTPLFLLPTMYVSSAALQQPSNGGAAVFHFSDA